MEQHRVPNLHEQKVNMGEQAKEDLKGYATGHLFWPVKLPIYVHLPTL
jgi:hypothetical protein